MTPETQELIKSWPNMTEEEAKLLFIRKSAAEAYTNGDIENSVKTFLKEEFVPLVVKDMSKEQVGMLIANLEKARAFLAAFTQGLQTGFAKEQEPIFREKEKARREKALKEKIEGKAKTNSSDKKVNDLIALARNLAMNTETGELEIKAKPTTNIQKEVCPKCNKEVLLLKFHKC